MLNESSRKILTIFVIFYSVFLIFWSLYLYTVSEKTTFLNYSYNLGYALSFFVGGFLGIVYGIKRNLRTDIGKALLFLGSGLASYGIGLVIWFVYNSALRIEVPYPSLADVFFLLFYPSIAVGVVFLLKSFQVPIKNLMIFDSLAILVVISLTIFIYFALIIQPNSENILEQVFNILYPVGDILIITICLIGIRVSPVRHWYLLLLIGGVFVASLADLTFAYRTAREIYWNGDIADMLFAIEAGLLSLGIISFVGEQKMSTADSLTTT